MAQQLRLTDFTIIGDSNVRRNMTSSVTSDRPVMANAQIVPSGRLSSFAASLDSTRLESNACVVSCISNFLSTSAPGPSAGRIERVITDFFTKIRSFCASRPEVSVCVCPPMYRTSPLWYRDCLPNILCKFSEIGTMNPKPANLHLLPSFTRSVLEPDGVHLTAFSGMEFVLHLFKSSESLLQGLNKSSEDKISAVGEDTRLLRDRVHFLELDHKRLSDKVEYREAVDAKLRDYEENLRNEPFFMIRGLARLPKLDPKEWQVRAVADVSTVLSLMNLDTPIKYIQNATGRGKNSVVHYRVRVGSAAESKLIRDKFSAFFHDGRDSRPASLSNISIRNCVTTATLGRIAILQLLGKRYTKANPGSRSTVVGYEPRPLLKLFPAPTATDKRVMTFNFIEAISKLPTCFSAEETAELLKRISPCLHSSLGELFVVVSQDSLRRSGQRVGQESASGQEPSNITSGSESSSPATGSSGRRSKKRGASGPQGPSAKK